MNNLLTDLRSHYQLLLKERDLANINLLKLKELIEINEKAIKQTNHSGREDEEMPSLFIEKRLSNEKINREDTELLSQLALQNREGNDLSSLLNNNTSHLTEKTILEVNR